MMSWSDPRPEVITMSIFIGIDLSLRSPGIASFHKGIWSIWCFATRQREVGLCWTSDDQKVMVKTLPIIPCSKAPDIIRYTHIVHQIKTHCYPVWPVGSCVHLEDYIYPKAMLSGSAYKIHELGGIVKYSLSKAGYTCQTVAPTAWKKRIGTGRMSKQQTLELVEKTIPQLNLMNLFGLVHSAKDPPNPVQDMADAIGIVLSVKGQ